LDSHGPLVLRADPIFPVIARRKISSGIAQDRHAQLLHYIDYVFTVSVGIGKRISFVVNAAVNHSPQMLREISKQERIHLTDLTIDIDLDPRRRRFGDSRAAKNEKKRSHRWTSTDRPSKFTGRVSLPQCTTSFLARASIFDPRASRSARVRFASF